MALFGFLKKKNSESTSPAPEQAKPVMNSETVIFTMPDKFLLPEKASFWTATKIWIVIGVVVVSLVGTVLWLTFGAKAPDTAATNQPTNEVSSNTPPPATTNEPTTPSILPTTNTPPPPDTTNTPAPTPSAPASAVLPTSLDTDGDSLTDVEEQLYGTDPAKADTDGDGYPDLTEMLSGYNPKGAGKLSDAKIFTSYTNSQKRYAISYPTSWTVRASGSAGDEVSFVASADEMIVVSVQPNQRGASITDWYHLIAPTVDTNSIAEETVGTHVGVFSPDRRTFYFIDSSRPNDVFVVSYSLGTKTETNFSATFEIMVRSVSVK